MNAYCRISRNLPFDKLGQRNRPRVTPVPHPRARLNLFLGLSTMSKLVLPSACVEVPVSHPRVQVPADPCHRGPRVTEVPVSHRGAVPVILCVEVRFHAQPLFVEMT